MARLVEFKIASSGTPIWVNPEHVVAVQQHYEIEKGKAPQPVLGQTTLTMDAVGMVVVNGGVRAIVDALQGESALLSGADSALDRVDS